MFRQCLLSAAQHTSWVLVKAPSRFAFHSFWLRNTSNNKFIQIDVWTTLHWKSIPWANTEWILKNRRCLRQFFIPSPVAEAGILLIKDLLQTGKIKPKYFQRIHQTAQKNGKNFHEFLAWSLGNGVACWLCEKTQELAWDTIEKQRIRFCLAAIGKTCCRNPVKAFLNFTDFLWKHLWSRLARPMGMFVVFIGPDGSGKTTVAKDLEKSLNPLFRHCQYYHGRFGLLPELKNFRNLFLRILGRKPSVFPKNQTTEQDTNQHSLLRSLVYVSYYSLDYFLGHWIVRKSQSVGNLIIFDRYFYDWFIQQYYGRIPRWFLPVLKFILPRPDIIVYLSNSPQIVYQRKQELTVEQIGEQAQRCQEIVQHIPYAETVSTNQHVNEIVREISARIFEIMAKRSYREYNHEGS